MSLYLPDFSITWSFRNHSNMLIFCSRNIDYYYQCWKKLCCLILLWKQFFFFLWWTFNIINVFTVSFDQFNTSFSWEKSMNFLKKKKKHFLNPNFWMVVYMCHVTDRHISSRWTIQEPTGEKAERKLDMTPASSRFRGQVGCWYSSVVSKSLTQIKSCCSNTCFANKDTEKCLEV